MSAPDVPPATQDHSASSRLLRAGLLTGVADATWASVKTLLSGRSVAGLWQGVASVPFGAGMLTGGPPAVLAGLFVHFCVAFTWSAVFLLLVTRSSWLRRVLSSPGGVFAVAAVYGPLIWIFMSAVVIPLFTHRPLVISSRWWIELAGHIVFVGLPIVWSIARGRRTRVA